MGKRLSEAVKLIEQQYRRKLKKERWMKTSPSFKNFDLDLFYSDNFANLDIVVTDILNVEERPRHSKINETKPYGATYLIHKIICPMCHQPATLNRHWNCYICTDPTHPKKAFEITSVTIPQPIKIKELD